MKKSISYTSPLFFVDTDGAIITTATRKNKVSVKKAKSLIRLFQALVDKYN